MISLSNNAVKPIRKLSFYHDPSVETKKRSFVKMITYELIILLLNFTTVYLITGHVRIAFGFVALSSTYVMLSYFMHERIWDAIKWGKVTK
jgi:adenylylsulfate kinase